MRACAFLSKDCKHSNTRSGTIVQDYLGFSFSVGAGWGHGVSHRALSFWPLISAAQHGGGTSIPPNDVVPI